MTKLRIRTIFLGLLIAVASQHARAQVDVNVSIGGFYDELAPYGRWVDCSYGQCWVPAGVSADWQPYTNGQWIYTSYGWTWASSDPWGASPFHYGSWTSIPGYGWTWVPGTTWAPAWVTWSQSASYVGWAPLPPFIVIGGSGYSGSAVVLSPAQYVFVSTNQFSGMNVASVRVPTLQSETIFRQTTPITRFSVTGGIVRNTAIPIESIQRAGGGRIETRDISFAKTAPRPFVAHGNGPVAVVASPSEIKAAVVARPKSAPASVAKTEEHTAQPKPRENPARAAQPSREPAAAPVAENRHQADAPHPAAQPRPVVKREVSPVPVKHGQEPAAAPPVAENRQKAVASHPAKPELAPVPVKHGQEPAAAPAQEPKPGSHQAAGAAKPEKEPRKPASEKPPKPSQSEKDKEPGR